MGGFDIFFSLKESDPKARIQNYIDHYADLAYQGFEGALMRSLHVISATVTNTPTPTSKSTFSLSVTPNLLNPYGTMHGGAVALLVDMCTTLAVAPLSKEGFWHFGGLSRTMGVTYLKPLEGGSTVWIECEVRSIGRRLATITCIIRDGKGVVLALGEHGKASVDIKPPLESSWKSKI